MPEFQVRRVLADADLDTPAGRDRALQEARPLIDATRERPALRDRLAQLIADELDIRPGTVLAQSSAPTARRPHPADPPTPHVTTGQLETERTFLVMCARNAEHGRDYLEKLTDEHLASALTRRARDQLLRHFDDPLLDVPEDDPRFGGLMTKIAHEASEPSHDDESVLRLSFIDLDRRRIERGLRRAEEERDMVRQRELSNERVALQDELHAVMEQTA